MNAVQDTSAPESGRGLRADAIAAAILIALIWVPFIVRMAQGLSALAPPLHHDIILQWVPFRSFINSSFDAGFFPLWSSQVFAGFPFAAFSHTGVFYPPSWVLLTGDYARDVNLFYPVHLCIAALGAFCLARRMGLAAFSAFFAAAAYVFTGKPYYFVHFLVSTCSNVWMPWLLLCFLGLIKRPTLLGMAGIAAFLSLQVLGGDVESTAYGLVLGLPAMTYFSWKRGWDWRRGWLIVPAFALAALLCLVTLLPLAEYSSHFIRNQGMTFAYFTQRKLPWQLIWSVLLPLTKEGEALGTGMGGPFFHWGALVALLALAAGIRRAEPSSRVLAVLALFGLLWSFGTIPALDRLQYSLPVLRSMGSPEQAFYLAQLLFAVLAGQGLQWLIRSRDRDGARTLAVIGVLALATALLAGGRADMSMPRWALVSAYGLIAVLGLMGLRLKLLSTRVTAPVFAAIHLAVIYYLAVAWLPANDPALYRQPEWLKDLAAKVRATQFRYIFVSDQGPLDQELVYHAGLALDLDAIDGWITVPPRDYAELLAIAEPRAASFVDGKLDHLGINADLKGGKFIDASAMPILDLLNLGFIIDRGVPLKFSSPYDLTQARPDFHRRSQVTGAVKEWEESSADRERLGLALLAGPQEVRRWRLFVQKGDYLTFAPELYLAGRKGPGAAGELRIDIKAGAAVETVYERKLTARPGSPAQARPGPARETVDLGPFAGREVELSILTAGPGRDDLVFALWQPWIENPDKPLQRVSSPAPGVAVYFNRDSLQRSFVVHQAEVLERASILERLRQANPTALLNTVFLERRVPGLEDLKLHQPWSGLKDQSRRLSREPGLETYQVASNGPGLLFISDQYYPGWRAFVAGEERPILRADHCFRALAVGSGESVVRFSFEPASFRIGLWASLASLALTSLIFLKRRLFR